MSNERRQAREGEGGKIVLREVSVRESERGKARKGTERFKKREKKRESERDEKKAPGSNPAPHYPIIYYASN